jgi:sulfite exporter TauE/SafE
VAGIIGALIVLAGVVVIESLVFMTYELASVAVMTETASPIEAITTALRRALAPGMKRRSLTGGIVVFLVSQAGLIPVLALAVLLTATTHVGALYYAVFGAGTVLLDGIVATFVVVFAVDARVRREGYDLFASGPVTAA